MKTLRDYQMQLVNGARKSFAKNHGVLVQSPAGSGKSLVIAEIIKRTVAKGNHVLFLVHRHELINQIKDTLISQEVPFENIDLLTVKKAKNRLETLKTPVLICIDETHHVLSKTYQDIIDFFDKSFRIGFTATPWRLSGSGFEPTYTDMIVGPTVKQLIDWGNLAPYKAYTVKCLYEYSELEKSSGDYSKKSANKAFKIGIAGNVVENYTKYAPDSKAILYAPTIAISEVFADEFNKAGIKAIHVDAKTPAAQRDGIMQNFKAGKIKVLCNVDLVSEGFDVPDCDCVIMARPTASLSLHIQQSMRCMRYKPNKVAKIIDCAGNLVRLGLPDDDFNWSLSPRPKHTKEHAITPIVVCDNCLATMRKNDVLNGVCPYCGKSIASIAKERHEAKMAELELVEIKRTSEKKIPEAKTPEEIYEIFKARKKISGGRKNPVIQTAGVLKRSDPSNYKSSIDKLCKDLGYKSGYSHYVIKSLGGR